MFLAGFLDLLSHVLYLMLHVTGSGSFPRALTPAQEKKALAELSQGSPEARRELIEHIEEATPVICGAKSAYIRPTEPHIFREPLPYRVYIYCKDTLQDS